MVNVGTYSIHGASGIEIIKNTVDGSEIRRSPVEVGSLSHYLQGFCTSQVVLWDFFHQRYHRSIWDIIATKKIRSLLVKQQNVPNHQNKIPTLSAW